MEWWERLGRIIESRNLDIGDVAKSAGIPVKSLYGYLKGETPQPRGDRVARLARAVHVSEPDLRHGNGSGTTVVLKRIPLLDMNKLGTLKTATNPLSVWDGITQVSVQTEIPDGAYGVRLADESGEPLFKQGDVIICDPGAEIVPGRFVVAVLTDEERAVFAKYRPAAHRQLRHFFLRPPNEDFPEIEVNSKTHKGFILARAVKHIRDI